MKCALHEIARLFWCCYDWSRHIYGKLREELGYLLTEGEEDIMKFIGKGSFGIGYIFL